MPERSLAIAACILLLACAAGAGCTSAVIGDVSYAGGILSVPVTNNAGPSDAFIQVTVYGIRDFHQEELTSVQQPVSLAEGENRVQIGLPLEPGMYKLYIYILKPGERQTAAIRDIVV